MYASPGLMWGAVLDIQGVKNCVPATTDFLSRKHTKKTIKTNKKTTTKKTTIVYYTKTITRRHNTSNCRSGDVPAEMTSQIVALPSGQNENRGFTIGYLCSKH